jgi:hypothetical protein
VYVDFPIYLILMIYLGNDEADFICAGILGNIAGNTSLLFWGSYGWLEDEA